MSLGVAGYREFYLASLQAEINNINRTYNAVQTNLSGNTVPETPPDMRSVEEKYADLERMKIDLRSKLMTITDGEQSGIIMNDLEDDPILIGLALSQFPEIYALAKEKYALGMPAPMFIEILKRLKSKIQSNAGVEPSLSEIFPPLPDEAQIQQHEEMPQRRPLGRAGITPEKAREISQSVADRLTRNRNIVDVTPTPRGNRRAIEHSLRVTGMVPEQSSSSSAAAPKGGRKSKSSGRGLMTGCGLSVTPKKRPPKIEGKVEKPASYVPFGRFVINKHKLNDGTLMLRTPKGGAISKLPTERISDNLTKIIQTISQGNIPSFDDMSKLSESEKRHIHNIVSHSHIDHISVPKPDLSKDEQDLHRFQVLKGECISGNSGKDVIKELKHLIVRLLSTGKLPKRQASEALVELASLGL